MAVIMYAKPIVTEIKKEIEKEVLQLKQQGITPQLACILANDDPRSKTYVFLKRRDCEEVGITSEIHKLFPSDVSKMIVSLNKQENVHGILVQLPLPNSVDVEKVFSTLSPDKDVDGLTPYNLGKLFRSEYDLNKTLLPCTSKGIMKMFQYYGLDVKGKDSVVVGRSTLVGNPMRKMLEDAGSTAVCFHTKTTNIARKLKSFDIIISAVGRPPEIYEKQSFKLRSSMIKKGAVVVNVGVRKNPLDDKLCFDVDFEDVEDKCSFITPNIGGVGLMTRVMLTKNVVIAAKSLRALPL